MGGSASAVWSGLFDLTGRTALVTGSARGLGFQMARVLAQAGASVVLNGRNPAALDAARDAIRRDGGAAGTCVFDVADGPASTSAVADLLQLHGAIDILVNNAGPRDRRGMGNLPDEAFSQLLSAHLVASYRLARLVAPGMVTRDAGRIINVASIAGLLGASGDVAYGAAKAGLLGLTRTLAAELGSRGVTVNAVVPGAFATEENATVLASPEVSARWASRTMLRRVGRPEEIAGAVLMLASSAGSYLTGQMIVVDGGLSAQM